MVVVAAALCPDCGPFVCAGRGALDKDFPADTGELATNIESVSNEIGCRGVWVLSDSSETALSQCGRR